MRSLRRKDLQIIMQELKLYHLVYVGWIMSINSSTQVFASGYKIGQQDAILFIIALLHSVCVDGITV